MPTIAKPHRWPPAGRTVAAIRDGARHSLPPPLGAIKSNSQTAGTETSLASCAGCSRETWRTQPGLQASFSCPRAFPKPPGPEACQNCGPSSSPGRSARPPVRILEVADFKGVVSNFSTLTPLSTCGTTPCRMSVNNQQSSRLLASFQTGPDTPVVLLPRQRDPTFLDGQTLLVVVHTYLYSVWQQLDDVRLQSGFGLAHIFSEHLASDRGDRRRCWRSISRFL